jgi:hypothetical protein
MDNSRCSPFVKSFEHELWYEPAGTCYWVMGLVPGATLGNLADDVEEVAPLKGELLGGWGTITTGRANDFLWRSNGGRGPGYRG